MLQRILGVLVVIAQNITPTKAPVSCSSSDEKRRLVVIVYGVYIGSVQHVSFPWTPAMFVFVETCCSKNPEITWVNWDRRRSSSVGFCTIWVCSRPISLSSQSAPVPVVPPPHQWCCYSRRQPAIPCQVPRVAGRLYWCRHGEKGTCLLALTPVSIRAM